MQQFLITLIIGIIVVAAYGAMLYSKPKEKPDPRIKVWHYCERNYRQIKKEINNCRSEKQIEYVTKEVDDFYLQFFDRVPDPRLRGLYRDLLITISAKKSKIVPAQ